MFISYYYEEDLICYVFIPLSSWTVLRTVLWIRNDLFRIRSRIRIRLFREFRIRSRIRILLRIRILYKFVWICIFIYAYVHTNTYIHTHTHYCLYVTNIYTIYIKKNPVSLSYHIQLYIYVRVYICVYVCIYVCIYIYIYIYNGVLDIYFIINLNKIYNWLLL